MDIYEEDNDSEAPIEISMDELNNLRDDCKDIIETADAAKRLLDNPDFVKVMQVGYFDKEPKRLGALIASGRMPVNAVDGAVEDLKSIGSCVNFLNDTVQKGVIAQSELDAAEAAYNEAIAAEAEE